MMRFHQPTGQVFETFFSRPHSIVLLAKELKQAGYSLSAESVDEGKWCLCVESSDGEMVAMEIVSHRDKVPHAIDKMLITAHRRLEHPEDY